MSTSLGYGGKRFFDLLVVILLFPIWLILTILLTLGYLCSANWPPIFIQARSGRNGEVFRMMKFRTLKEDASLPIQGRRFGWGNFLRRTGLDELPQVVHVLTGKMSLVGPRPLPPEYLPLFEDAERQRLKLRPGITGWAQVNGRHGIPWEKKFELDSYYISNVSFQLDLKILFKTIVLFLSPGEDQSLHEEKFKGH